MAFEGEVLASRREVVIATITIRNLDDEILRRLKRRAAENNRSLEAEARAILSAAVSEGGFAKAWVNAASELRGAEILVPERSQSREVDLE